MFGTTVRENITYVDATEEEDIITYRTCYEFISQHPRAMI